MQPKDQAASAAPLSDVERERAFAAGLAEGRKEGIAIGERTGETRGFQKAQRVAAAAIAGLKADEPTLASMPALRDAGPVIKVPAPPLRAVPPLYSRETESGDLSAPARALLEEAQRRFPCRFTWGQLASLTKRKARGGSFNSARKQLLEGGHVTEDGSLVVPTKAEKRPALTRDQLLDIWREALPSPADELLATIAQQKAGISASDLAALTGRQPRGGSWNGAIATLRANGLIKEVARGVFTIGDLANEAA